LLEANTSVFLSGRPQSFKSTLAALVQAHFGPRFSARALPVQWLSTPSYLEQIAFSAKDVLLVIDDFFGEGRPDRQQQQTAQRLLRAAGNRTGRGRVAPQTGKAQALRPRGLIVATGEKLPEGSSLRARLLEVPVHGGEVDLKALSAAQAQAAEGRLAEAMAGYIQWLAPRRNHLAERLPGLRAKLRDKLSVPGHPRGKDAAAALLAGTRVFLCFAVKIKALSEDEAKEYWRRVRSALERLVDQQALRQQFDSEEYLFLALVGAGLAWVLAHLERVSGQWCCPPDYPTLFGWEFLGTVGIAEDWPPYRLPRFTYNDARAQQACWFGCHTSFSPRGTAIGWVGWPYDPDQSPRTMASHEMYVYLHPAKAYQLAQKVAKQLGCRLELPLRTLIKRLKQEGLLIRSDTDRNTYKVWVRKQRENVLLVSAKWVLEGHRLIGSEDCAEAMARLLREPAEAWTVEELRVDPAEPWQKGLKKTFCEVPQEKPLPPGFKQFFDLQQAADTPESPFPAEQAASAEPLSGSRQATSGDLETLPAGSCESCLGQRPEETPGSAHVCAPAAPGPADPPQAAQTARAARDPPGREKKSALAELLARVR